MIFRTVRGHKHVVFVRLITSDVQVSDYKNVSASLIFVPATTNNLPTTYVESFTADSTMTENKKARMASWRASVPEASESPFADKTISPLGVKVTLAY